MYALLGNVLLSQDPAVQVPSALKGLTVVFGMGMRGTLSPSPPNRIAMQQVLRLAFLKESVAVYS